MNLELFLLCIVHWKPSCHHLSKRNGVFWDDNKSLRNKTWSLTRTYHQPIRNGGFLDFEGYMTTSGSDYHFAPQQTLQYIYIYATPPLKSLPFLWVSSVQTAERFLRWNTNSVKTLVFVRIIRFILFTLLVLKRSTLFRKGSQY